MAGLMIAAELVQRRLVQLKQDFAELFAVRITGDETLSVNLAQRADEGVSMLVADFAILVAVAIVETCLAHAALHCARVRQHPPAEIKWQLIGVHHAAIKFLYGVYKEAPEPGSHSYGAMRMFLRSGILKRPPPRRRCVSSCNALDDPQTRIGSDCSAGPPTPGRYDVSPCCRQQCPSPGRPAVDWQAGGTRPLRLPVDSVHRWRGRRLAVLRRCGQTDYREFGAAARPDFMAAAGKTRAFRATGPTCRSGGRRERSTSATGSSGSDRTGRRRRLISRIDAVASVDGARSRERGARDRADQGQHRADQGQPATNAPQSCQAFRAEAAAQDIGAFAAGGRRAGARCTRSS